MTWDRVERLIGKGNLERLAEKRVAVLGLGSGGGFVALSLAMSGVRRFVLVDDDVLEPANLVRHVADDRYLGVAKAEAVADLIRHRNPDADLVAVRGRVEDHRDLLTGVDLVVVGVDGEAPKYVINEVCLDEGIPAVYAGVYERGEGGDVCLIRPLDGPCYACWAENLRDDAAVTKAGPEELDYGMIGPGGTLEAQPGLWMHVVRVAAAQADIALNELLRGADAYRELPGNTVILANTALEILDGDVSLPQTALWAAVERDPDCLVCGGRWQQRAGATEPMSLDELIETSGLVNAPTDEDAPARREDAAL
jgi:molybdopterin/thiamine biosynthesis adenylyltransferase